LTRRRLTYADSGVDITAADKAVELIKPHVRSTQRAEVIGDIGGFGGLFSLASLDRRDPVLVASTDGVGTKSAVARLADRYDTIGLDAVAMSVDDVAATGAEPLFLLDYLSVGRLVPEQVEEIVGGIAEGCRQAGCALLGGEMSEHPGVMEPGDFDLVTFAVGVAERGELLPAGVAPGDEIVGLASPGLRCNGYSLARAALLDAEGEAAPALLAELLEPSVIYAPVLARVRAGAEVHALAHVTGGGIPGNLDRVLPEGCDGIVHRGRWPEPAIFNRIREAGGVSDEEMAATFNLGLGMLAVVAPGQGAAAVAAVTAAGVGAWPVGEIVTGTGRVRIAD
jgi:phosphoribosylformylglycinamidine cyclo-ligase